MNRKAVIAALPLAGLLMGPTWARDFSSSAEGTTTANFLKLGVGARAVAMGDAYSAVADEATALYWNPAGLTHIERYSAAFMHAPYLAGSFYDYAAYGQRIGEHGALGAGVQYFSAGRITETDLAGTDVGSFTPYDLAASLAYAHAWNGYAVGAAGKFIKSKLINSAQTGAADIGFMTPRYFQDRLRLAGAVSNLGGNMTFDQTSSRLPLSMRLGSSCRMTERWMSSLDLTFPIDDNPYVAVGTEYLWRVASGWPVAARAGYNSQTTGDVSGLTGFSFGVGVERRGMAFDYAVLPFGSLGLTHRISFGIRFAGPENPSVLKTSRLPDDPSVVLGL